MCPDSGGENPKQTHEKKHALSSNEQVYLQLRIDIISETADQNIRGAHQKGDAGKGETSLATLKQRIDRFPKSLRFFSEEVVPVYHISHGVESQQLKRQTPPDACEICCNLLLLGIEKLCVGLDMLTLELLSICNESKFLQKLHLSCLLQTLI